MSDRKLKITELNDIDACRKMANIGVVHNFMLRNSSIKSYDSKLANEVFTSLISSKEKKVMWGNTLDTYNDPSVSLSKNFVEIAEWIMNHCADYAVMLDHNVFFDSEADRTAFILKFNS